MVDQIIFGFVIPLLVGCGLVVTILVLVPLIGIGALKLCGFTNKNSDYLFCWFAGFVALCLVFIIWVLGACLITTYGIGVH